MKLWCSNRLIDYTRILVVDPLCQMV